MRELAITLDYEPGADPVTDVFIDHPDLVAQALDIAVSGGLVRADRLSGAADALDRLAEVYLDPAVCNECVAPHGDCDADRAYEVIEADGAGWTVYTYHTHVGYCHSVPYLASTTLPPGLLFDSRRRADRHEWRVLMREDGDAGALYDALVADLPDGVAVSFQRLTGPERWGGPTGTLADLPPEQRAAIETAIELAYYDTPRGATLADVADALGIPQSTARYRLRRAEAWLTDRYVAGWDTANEP